MSNMDLIRRDSIEIQRATAQGGEGAFSVGKNNEWNGENTVTRGSTVDSKGTGKEFLSEGRE